MAAHHCLEQHPTWGLIVDEEVEVPAEDVTIQAPRPILPPGITAIQEFPGEVRELKMKAGDDATKIRWIWTELPNGIKYVSGFIRAKAWKE